MNLVKQQAAWDAGLRTLYAKAKTWREAVDNLVEVERQEAGQPGNYLVPAVLREAQDDFEVALAGLHQALDDLAEMEGDG